MCIKKILDWFKDEDNHITPVGDLYKISGADLTTLSRAITGANNWTFDEEYYFPSYKKFKEILAEDRSDAITYILEKRDCDNIAVIFSAHMSECYGINSTGVTVGALRHIDTNRLLGYHAWNSVIVYDEDIDALKLLFVEPQNDEYSEFGSTVKLCNKTYVPEIIFWW